MRPDLQEIYNLVAHGVRLQPVLEQDNREPGLGPRVHGLGVGSSDHFTGDHGQEEHN